MIRINKIEEDCSDNKVTGHKSVATLCRFESITKTVLQKGYCAGFIRHKWS